MADATCHSSHELSTRPPPLSLLPRLRRPPSLRREALCSELSRADSLAPPPAPVRQVETATRRRGAGPPRHSPGVAQPAGGASGARTRRPDVAARALGPAGMRALLSLVLTAGTYVRRARTRGRREADPPTRPVSRRPAAPPAAGGGLPAPCAPHPRIRRCVPSPHRPWDRQILNPARRGGGARHTLGWSPSCAALQEPLALSEPPVPDGDQGDRGRECSRSGE